MSLSVARSNGVYIDAFYPLVKEAATTALVWAVFAKVFGFNFAFPALVCVTLLPFCLYGFYLARKGVPVDVKREPYLNPPSLNLLKMVNSKTKEGAPRLALNRFFKHLLTEELKLYICSENKITLHFYKEGYRFSKKDKAWLIIPAIVVLNITHSGVCEFEKRSELYEIKYSHVFFQEKIIWKKIHPGSHETFTVDVERKEGWLNASRNVREDMLQKEYKDLFC